MYTRPNVHIVRCRQQMVICPKLLIFTVSIEEKNRNTCRSTADTDVLGNLEAKPESQVHLRERELGPTSSKPQPIAKVPTQCNTLHSVPNPHPSPSLHPVMTYTPSACRVCHGTLPTSSEMIIRIPPQYINFFHEMNVIQSINISCYYMLMRNICVVAK